MPTDRRTRRSRAFVVFFLVVFLAMIWPVYPLFNRISPFVFGIPFSLFYQMILVAAAFLGLFTFHWLDGDPNDEDEDA